MTVTVQEQEILNICEERGLIASAKERPLTSLMQKYLDFFAEGLRRTAPSQAEASAMERRFLFEQDRAWAGLPEYTVSTHFGNNGKLEEQAFKEARIAHIDAQILAHNKP